MAATKVDKALDDIEKWTVLELVEFTKKAEERWGVTAAVAMAPSMAPAAREGRSVTCAGSTPTFTTSVSVNSGAPEASVIGARSARLRAARGG